jgi:hypothetical protein
LPNRTKVQPAAGKASQTPWQNLANDAYAATRSNALSKIGRIAARNVGICVAIELNKFRCCQHDPIHDLSMKVRSFRTLSGFAPAPASA